MRLDDNYPVHNSPELKPGPETKEAVQALHPKIIVIIIIIIIIIIIST